MAAAKRPFTKGDRVRTVFWIFVILLAANLGVAFNNAYGTPVDIRDLQLGTLSFAAFTALMTLVNPQKADSNGDK